MSVFTLTFLSVVSVHAKTLDLNAILKKGGRTITLPEGEYNVKETFRIYDLDGITVQGKNTLLIFEPDTIAIDIRRSKNITLKNFSLDYRRLSFTQGTVINTDPSTYYIDVQLHKGYADIMQGIGKKQKKALALRMHLFHPKTRRWKNGSPDLFSREYRMIGERRYRIKWKFETFSKYVKSGDLIAIDWRHKDAICISGGTENFTMENVNIHSSPNVGVLARFCGGGHKYKNVKIFPGKKPDGATEPRLLSTCADGINYGRCSSGPEITGCEFSFMGDDGINLHGALFAVFKVESSNSIIVMRAHRYEDFPKIYKSGSELRFMRAGNYEIVHKGVGKVLEKLGQPEEWQNEAREFYIKTKLTPYKHLKDADNYTLYRIKLSTPLNKLKSGMFMDIPSLNSSGYRIADNYFHDHRARGLRIMASNGVIENNRFERISQSAITIGAEYAFWREAGWVENVVIRGNKISDVCRGWYATAKRCYTPGAICTFIRNDRLMPSYSGHRNIRIENNSINGSRNAGIYLYAIKDSIVSKNRIKNVCRGGLEGDISQIGKYYGLHVSKALDIADSAVNITVSENIIE